MSTTDKQLIALKQALVEALYDRTYGALEIVRDALADVAELAEEDDQDRIATELHGLFLAVRKVTDLYQEGVL